MIAIALYLSARSQRIFTAVLCLFLAHALMASCTPEPVVPMAASVVYLDKAYQTQETYLP